MPPTASEVLIGNRVRDLRRERRWTQARLAAVLGVSQGYLSKLERGGAILSAGQLLILLRRFNVPLEYFSPEKRVAEDQIHNALARHGASHLAESADILPTERLKRATDSIREALVSAEASRQVAAVAPVLVDQAGRINLTRLRNEFASLGLDDRLGWAIDCTLAAIKLEGAEVLPRKWRLKYRRAALIIEDFFGRWRVAPSPTANPGIAPQYDVFDPDITSRERLEETLEQLSPEARRWRVATAIGVDDFARALRAARGAD